MNKFVASFQGGMNQQVDYALLGEGEYPLLVNGRVRDGVVTGIKKPLLLGLNNGMPNGTNMQGVYSIGQYSIVFLDGFAYVRDFGTADTKWNKLVGFQMDANAEYIYAEAVPASRTNFQRTLNDGNDVTKGVAFKSSVNQQAASIICQDGINQPLIIGFDGSVRVSQTYEQWTKEFPEYVPIGKQMLWKDPVLYTVSPDGKQVYRSVSGRPFDHMIIVDTNGEKQADPNVGNAGKVSFGVSGVSVKAIKDLNSTDNSIYVSTGFASYFVLPDFTQTFFGEPTYTQQYKADSGSINQFSYSQELGDQLYVDKYGIRSFNAAVISPESGKNLPFSKKVWKLFGTESEPVEQDVVAMCKFSNYTFAAMKTIFGYRVLVHDELNNQFVSLDNWTNGVAIKMFSEVNVSGIRMLLFITVDGKCYQAFGNQNEAITGIYIGNFTGKFQESPSSEVENTRVYQKLDQVIVSFTDVLEPGIVLATPYADSKAFDQRQQYVSQDNDIVPDNVAPIPNPETNKLRTVTFNFNPQAVVGKEIGCYFEWDFKANLMDVLFRMSDHVQNTGKEQRSAAMSALIHGLPTITLVDKDEAHQTENIKVTGTKIDKVTKVYLGSSECQIIAKDKTSLTFVVPETLEADVYKLFLVSQDSIIESDEQITITNL